jgi:surface polysaccharide O-acyltransferase-like enzyme
MKQRMREMDFIRAVSALSIIVIHVSGVYTLSSRGAFATNQLVRFAVPVFLLISGLLLSLSGYEFNGISGYLKFLSKRLKKIFIPYIVWSFIYILFKMGGDYTTIWSDPAGFLADTGRRLLYGSAYIHLYFIIIILQLYLLFPILQYLMKRYRELVIAVGFTLTLVFQTGIYLQSMKLLVFPAPILPNYMFFPTWIFFFVFGMSFAGNLEVNKKRFLGKPVTLIYLALACAASFALVLLDGRLTGTFGLSVRPTVILFSISAFLLMYTVASKLVDSRLRVLKCLDWISAQSFTIYLSHLFIIKLLTLATGHPANSGMWSGLKGMLILYAAGTLCTCLFAYLVSITPFASILGGVGIKKKKSGKPDSPIAS